jgi:hypothetical protein
MGTPPHLYRGLKIGIDPPPVLFLTILVNYFIRFRQNLNMLGAGIPWGARAILEKKAVTYCLSETNDACQNTFGFLWNPEWI